MFAYQLAVTVDDGLMGVTEVVRGNDLIGSTARQIWLHRLFGFRPPVFYHMPLLLAPDGRRLSKRDEDLDLGLLRTRMPPERLIGALAFAAGLIDRDEAVSAPRAGARVFVGQNPTDRPFFARPFYRHAKFIKSSQKRY